MASVPHKGTTDLIGKVCLGHINVLGVGYWGKTWLFLAMGLAKKTQLFSKH